MGRPPRSDNTPTSRLSAILAGLSLAAILVSLVLRAALGSGIEGQSPGLRPADVPLLVCLAVGGGVLVAGLALKIWRGEFGSDLLAGIAIVASIWLGEYLAGSLVVLMLSGGEALEAYAVRSASSVLAALARRMPAIAHRRHNGSLSDIALDNVAIGDALVVLPHEICPVDGTVLEGHGDMDESYLTGEPYVISKAPGSTVLSGAINGPTALTVKADRRAHDSRYAKIMQVMRESEQRRPRLRRLGEQLGALYTPLAIGIALFAWATSGAATRFLAVLVVATPCPLLIAIPVALIGSISLAARRGIIIRDPAVLERVDTCRTAIFDKTGTLTYARPELTEVVPQPGFEQSELLSLAASLDRYSKHPLALAIVEGSRRAGVRIHGVSQIQEPPGEGMLGTVAGRSIQITGRKKLLHQHPELESQLPSHVDGLECVIRVDDQLAGTFRFRDQPRQDGPPFIDHLRRRHRLERVLLVSGDREPEVRRLAALVGIERVFAGQTPEQKLEIVRAETRIASTIFVGDGINDAPALTAATVGIALGQGSDITAEAAGAVIMESSLQKVDEFLHISRRQRAIALQSAIGGMALSVIGMAVAAAGYLPPAAGAITQEVIDVLAVGNALRVAFPPQTLTDY
jgi:heavy metal translocating P-type ATPase